jgi:hypothetical protein
VVWYLARYDDQAVGDEALVVRSLVFGDRLGEVVGSGGRYLEIAAVAYSEDRLVGFVGNERGLVGHNLLERSWRLGRGLIGSRLVSEHCHIVAHEEALVGTHVEALC